MQCLVCRSNDPDIYWCNLKIAFSCTWVVTNNNATEWAATGISADNSIADFSLSAISVVHSLNCVVFTPTPVIRQRMMLVFSFCLTGFCSFAWSFYPKKIAPFVAHSAHPLWADLTFFSAIPHRWEAIRAG